MNQRALLTKLLHCIYSSGDSVAGKFPRRADLACTQSSSFFTADQPSGYPSSNYDKGVCSHGDMAALHQQDQDDPLEGTPGSVLTKMLRYKFLLGYLLIAKYS